MSEELNNTEVIETEIIEQEIKTDMINDEVIEMEKPKVADQVPLSVLLEEKKRRKDLEKRLRQLEDKELEAETLTEKQKIKQRYTSQGYDENIADLLAEDYATLKSEIKKTVLHNNRKDYLDEEIEDLSRDSFYSDATAYQKEIKSKLSEFKSKGIELSVEDAYNLVRNPKIKLKELKEDSEQKTLLNRRNDTKTIIPNASASIPKNPYPLDDVDKKALVGLQTSQPNSNWTAEKYYKIRYGK